MAKFRPRLSHPLHHSFEVACRQYRKIHNLYVIRFRGNIYVTDAHGEMRQAQDWVGQGGRARTLRGASVTADQYRVGTVVCVQEPGMKEPWCLAASIKTDTARTLMKYYANDRGGLPRHQGPALWDGHGIDSHRLAHQA